ncbi:FUSC family protein [Cerasicoccus maritimus]|uniref:FUSC family protein n=1 Tax=Cerasicoccus maritimus TaxID=490089 RepID=UPI002852679F|nr:FUSC family protein [Cerasicoccus maritimus]
MIAKISQLKTILINPLLRAMLSANQLRLLTSFKTALAVVIALGIAMKLNWERPYWTGITVFITFLPYVGAAFEKSVLRVLGTITAGFIAYLLTGWFEQDQLMMTISLFVILGIFGYGGTGKVYPYFFILGGITLCIILGTTIVYPDALWYLVLFRTLEVCLGVVVALTVNNLIFPQKASNAFRNKASTTLESCDTLLGHAIAKYQTNTPLPDNVEAQTKLIAADFSALMNLFHSALRDSSRILHHQHAMEELLREMRQIYVAIVTVLRAASSDFPKELQHELQAELDGYVSAIQSDLSQIIEDLRQDRPARRLTKLHDARETLRDKVNALRAEGISYQYAVDDAINFYAYLGDLTALHDSMIRLVQADRALYRDASARELPPRIRPKPNGWKPDALRLRHAIKVGIACIIALYAYLWLQWPSGVTSFLTCSIVMQVSAVASNQKSMLRLGGCLLGGIFGAFTLTFIEPNFATYYTYCVPLFFIFAFFSWINNGPVKYAYAGFQAQLAFLLMTSISAEQSIDLAAGVDRFLGILLGVFIAALVHRIIWPVLPEKEFARELRQFFNRARCFMLEQDDRIASEQSDATGRAQEKDLARIEVIPAKSFDWLSQIGFRDNESKDHATLMQIYLHVQAISFALRGMSQANARNLNRETLDLLRPQLKAMDHALADVLQRCELSFQTNAPIAGSDYFKTARIEMEKQLTKLLRVDRATRKLSNEELGAFLSLVRRYREAGEYINACEQEIRKLNFEVLKRSAFF